MLIQKSFFARYKRYGVVAVVFGLLRIDGFDGDMSEHIRKYSNQETAYSAVPFASTRSTCSEQVGYGQPACLSKVRRIK